ncbi:MAG: tetratricopeptide repeat protein [Acidobacteria bacterium]|nr:tetratricopeptide repeat protein [Acidobacteriota bacterium]
MTWRNAGDYHTAVNSRIRAVPGLAAVVVLALLCTRPALVQEGEEASAERIRSAIEAGRLDEAIADARRAAAQFPRSSEVHRLLGAALFKKGLNADARGAFRRAIELDAGIPENYFNLALVELSESRYAEASRSLEDFIRLEPSNALARVLLGRAYHNQNRTAHAIEQFRKALKLAPQLPLAHYHLGFALQSQGNLSEALAEYEQEINLNPGFYETYHHAGSIQLGRGNLAAAEELFQKGIALRPQAAQAHYGLARVLRKRGDLAGAEGALMRVIGLQPAHVEAHYALARIYQQLGRKDEAAREFKIVADLHARNARRSSGIAGIQNP